MVLARGMVLARVKVLARVTQPECQRYKGETDDANRAIPGNVEMQVAKFASILRG